MSVVKVSERRAKREAREICALLKLDCGEGREVERLARRRAQTLALMLRLYCEVQKARRC